MANSNFIVQNGLTVGPLTIDAATGSITTTGAVNISGGLAVSTINKNDSSITINDTGTGSNVSIVIDGVTEHTIDANGVNLASGDRYAINGASVLNSTTLGSSVVASSLTSVGQLTGLTVNGTIVATTLNAGTIGNTGATLTGTLSTAAQTNITSVGTLTGLRVNSSGIQSDGTIITSTLNAATIGNTGSTLTGTLSTATQNSVTTMTGLTSLGTAGVTTTAAGNFVITGCLTVNGTTTTINNTIQETTEYVQTIDATTVRAVTLGNTGATLTGTLSTASQTNITAVGTLTAGAIGSGFTAIPNSALANSSVTVTAGTGMSGGGTVSLGGTITLTNAGVTSVVAGTAISVSGSTGAVTINNTGVTSAVAGTGVSVSGSTGAVTISIGQAVGTGNSPTFAGISVPSITHTGTSGTGDIGASGATFGTVWATATSAKYADLAENYQGDRFYNPGTVVMFGGVDEVTVADADTTRVAGVVSTNPAHLMNGALQGSNVVPVAFTGRVPCQVIGPVAKGDIMVSAGFGYAKVNNTPQVGTIIGKALTDFPIASKGVIEVVVGRF